MSDFQIFTDGSFRSSRNAMGIGILWIKNGTPIFKYSKGIKGGTNNIAELTAIYVALKSIKKPINSLEIISDSEYSIGVISNPTWKPKKNVKLIRNIKKQLEETQKLVKEPIKFTHTYGHQANDSFITRNNNLVDNLAQTASLI